MSSESEDQSLLVHSESSAQELAKQSRITYTRVFLFSLANVDAGKQLPSGIEPSILCELDSIGHDSSQSSHDDSDSQRLHSNFQKGLLPNSEYHGLLGNGTLLGVCGRIPGASAPKFQDNSHHLLHKSKEPFRPSHLHKTVNRSGRNSRDLDNDETSEYSECLSQNEEEKEKMGKDFSEVMMEGQEKLIQEVQNKHSNEHDKNPKVFMPPEDSANEKRTKCEKADKQVMSSQNVDSTSANAVSGQKLSPGDVNNSLIPELCDLTANRTKSPAICCSKFSDQFLVADTSPTGGSESMHGVSKDLTRDPSYCTGSGEQLQSTQAVKHFRRNPWDLCNDETSGPSECLSQNEEEERIRRDLYELMTDEPKNVTQEKQKENSNEGLHSTVVSSSIQQSSVGSSATNDVLEMCKFPIPTEDNYVFPSTIDEYGFIEIDCEDSKSSSSDQESKSRENQLVSDDFVEKIGSGVQFDPGLKLNPVSCFDEKDSLPIELLLPDEDSLITVDDFRVSSSSPVDICRRIKDENFTSPEHACKSPANHVARLKMGKISFNSFNSQSAQAQMSSQVKPITSNYNAHKPPTTFHQQLQKILIPGWILPPQVIIPIQGFPFNSQSPSPGFHDYGSTNDLGLAGLHYNDGGGGTGFYRG